MLFVSAIAIGQNTTSNLPSATDAPGKPLPKLCTAEPIETPLPRWMEGSSEVELVVGADGKVHETQIVKSNFSEQDEADIDKSIRGWRFKPTYFRGHYVNAKMLVELEMSKTDLHIRFPNSGCKNSPFPTM